MRYMGIGFKSHSALYLKIWFIRLYRFYSETTNRGTWLQHQGLGYAHRQHQGIVGWHRSRAGGIDDGYSARP